MATQRIGETDVQFKARRRREDMIRRESGPAPAKPTPTTPLAQGHWFGPDLLCENAIRIKDKIKRCGEAWPASGSCLSTVEINPPEPRRAQG